MNDKPREPEVKAKCVVFSSTDPRSVENQYENWASNGEVKYIRSTHTDVVSISNEPLFFLTVLYDVLITLEENNIGTD